MKKKLFVIVIGLCMVFAFTACGGNSSTSDETATDETTAAVEEETTAEAAATNSDEEATEGFTKAEQGETLEFDWGDFTIGNFDYGEYLENKNGTHYNPSNDNYYMYLPIEFKNKSKEGIELKGWWMLGNIVIDGDYNYEAEGKQIDGDWTIQPLETRTLYVAAEVPPEVAESFKTVDIQFAFNDELDDYDVFDDTITDLDHVYEVKVKK